MEKILKNGVCKLTEFELRLINSDGDAIEVLHCSSEDEARQAGKRYVGREDCMAIVVEKHVSYRPAHLAPSDPDKYITLHTEGSIDALEAGGWVSGEKAKFVHSDE